MKLFNLLFGFTERVERGTYLVVGTSLMILKYLGEVGFYYLACERVLTPINFFSPLLYSRYPQFQLMPDWFAPVVLLWSLPFIWIGTSMSIRRSVDANVSPWVGILFFVPVLNYVLMLALSVLPSRAHAEWQLRSKEVVGKNVGSPFKVAVIFALLGTLLTWINANLVKQYMVSLFVACPLVLGLGMGFFLNRNGAVGLKRTVLYTFFSVLLIHLLLLVFALEGLICLAMSLPLSLALGFMGAIFGGMISRFTSSSPVMPSVLTLLLFVMPIAEKQIQFSAHQDMVLSEIEINSPPTKVWSNVIKFSDLPPATDWLFRLGVAHPVRAKIEGSGVGAFRRCEFSTGAFVEPITVWNEPQHLAFDVSFSPAPMRELSFYDSVDAHLILRVEQFLSWQGRNYCNESMASKVS